MNPRYSMVIRWSEEDQVFVVSFPEFGQYAQTHGETYEDAARNGSEVLELLIESFQADQRPMPVPDLYEASKNGSLASPLNRQTTAQ